MKKNKGVTLISLSITVIILIILSTITITSMIVSMDEVQSDAIDAELSVLQNAVLQRYTKYTLTKNSDILVGNTVTDLTATDWSTLGITNTSEYKQLDSLDLADLGIENYKVNCIYVVNYINGDVIIKTADGVLYNN